MNGHWRYPKEVAHRSLTTLREKLVKIGARMVRHGRYITFQLAEVAVSRQVFGQILVWIARLRAPPVSIHEAGGESGLSPSTSLLPERAAMPTLKLRTDGYLGNVG